VLLGHVPGKLCDKQLEWAIIDLEVRVENLDNFVKTHPEFQKQIFVENISFKEDVLKLTSSTIEQITEKYEHLKTVWFLPELSRADRKPYVESLAFNYSTALERYANDEQDDIFKSRALEQMGTAEGGGAKAPPLYQKR
jgi:hypothetical protein